MRSSEDDELERWIDEVRDVQRALLRSLIERSGLTAALRELDDMWRAEEDDFRMQELRDLADRLAAVDVPLSTEEVLPAALLDRLRAMQVDLRATDEDWFRRR